MGPDQGPNVFFRAGFATIVNAENWRQWRIACAIKGIRWLYGKRKVNVFALQQMFCSAKWASPLEIMGFSERIAAIFMNLLKGVDVPELHS